MPQAQGGSGSQASLLSDLGAYLTLERAEKHGFSAEKAGLSPDEAAQVAVAFSRFDLDDDGVLSAYEWRKLL